MKTYPAVERKRPILTLGGRQAGKTAASMAHKPLVDDLKRMAKDQRYAMNAHALLRAAADIEIAVASMGTWFDVMHSGTYQKALRVYYIVTGEQWAPPDLHSTNS